MVPYSNQEITLLLEELDRINAQKVRAAFLYLVTDAKTRTEYVTRPDKHGYIYDFRYYRNDKWVYSFIPNQESLLWYFRRPLLNDYAVDVVSLRQVFEEVRITNGEEIAVRLCSLEDAQNVVGYLI